MCRKCQQWHSCSTETRQERLRNDIRGNWMRTTKRFLVTSLIIFSTSCLQVSCCSKPVPSERSALIDNLDSFLSPEEVRARLNTSEGTWRIAGRSSFDRGDPRPRFDILVVEVENYESSGVRGKLKLVFFN